MRIIKIKFTIILLNYLTLFTIISNGNDGQLLSSNKNSTMAQTPTCPLRCICTPSPSAPTALKSIVCTCQTIEGPTTPPSIPIDDDYAEKNGGFTTAKSEEASENHLYFRPSSFDLWTSVERIVVHSCKRLTLAQNAFYGAEIIDQLKFVDIGRLEVQSHAFAGIRRSPKHIVVQDSGVQTIASHAFSGLANIDHFWWRNVTIARIMKLAFFKVFNIDYMYFRNVRANIVEAGAFAHMHHIRHFFMRQGMRLGMVGDYAFVGSKIEELMLEDVNMHTTDLMLVGTNAKRIQILDSNWIRRPSPPLTRRRVPIQHVDDFYMCNSTLNRLSFAHFYNFSTILFEKSHIIELHGAAPIIAITNSSNKLVNFVAFNISNVHFKLCHLTQWQSHAFSGAYSIGVIAFTESRIFSIHRHALHEARIDQLRLTKTRVKSIAAYAFAHNVIDIIILEHVEVGSLGDLFLYKTRIVSTLALRDVNIRYLNERAFASITECERADIARCIFGELPRFGFENSKINSLTIRDSKFFGLFIASIFNRLDASQLSVVRSEFNCVKTACEENALLLHKKIHSNIAWNFENNRCVSILSSGLTANSEDSSLSQSFYQDRESQSSEEVSFSLFPETKKGTESSSTVLKETRTEVDDANICAEEVQTVYENMNYGMVCRRRIFIEECICTDQPDSSEESSSTTSASTEYVKLPDTTAKILLVGDCRRLEIEKSTTKPEIAYNNAQKKRWHHARHQLQKFVGRPHLQFVYLYRIDSLYVGSELDDSLKQLHLLYSNIYIVQPVKLQRTNAEDNESKESIKKRSDTGADLDEIRVTGSIVEQMGPFAFAGHRRVGALIFNRTIVREINQNAFAQSNVGRVELWHSDVLTVGDMMTHVDEMRVEQSRLPLSSTKSSTPTESTGLMKNFLSPYELCMLLGGKHATPSYCKKCMKNNNCLSNYSSEIALNGSTIIKRCAVQGNPLLKREKHSSRECEYFLAPPPPVLSDIQVSVISHAISLFVVSHILLAFPLFVSVFRFHLFVLLLLT